jgi:hypothetical protein
MTRSSTRHILAAIAVATLIIAIQVTVGVAVYNALPDWPTRGQFGDVFGAVNATFSGLAFAGLVYAILLQREDLELQRRELELTRQELQRTAAAQEQAEVALRAQAEAASVSAKLSATSFLLRQYQEEIEEMRKDAFLAGDPRLKRMQELEDRIKNLGGVLDSFYNAVAKEADANVKL